MLETSARAYFFGVCLHSLNSNSMCSVFLPEHPIPALIIAGVGSCSSPCQLCGIQHCSVVSTTFHNALCA